MAKDELMEKALDRIFSELDEIEGKDSMKHSLDECPDPLTCGMHDDEAGESLAPEGKDPAAIEIKVHKLDGMPTIDGAKEDEEGASDEGLSAEEAEALRKILSK